MHRAHRCAVTISTTLLLTAVASAGSIDAGRGPVDVVVPSSYDPSVPTPLVLLLHGYSSTGALLEARLQLAPLAEEFGFFYLHPDGLPDALGNQFWNATEACCDFFGAGPDDSGYLRELIAVMGESYNVDPNRVYIAGHSNGGFMSHRMACDHSGVIAAIASFAGATYLDPTTCAPVSPVHVLQIHGTNDTVIAYDGGCIPFLDCYPGAQATVADWAFDDGCTLVPDDTAPPLDLVPGLPGAETTVRRYDMECAPDGSAMLWTVAGGSHAPEQFSPQFSRLVVEYFLANPKGASCPTDIDGSGDTGFGDLLEVLASWGDCSRCPADLDDSGDVGFQDLLTVLSSWGPCP